MDIETLSSEQKEAIWQGMQSNGGLLEGFPYIALGSKDAFFGENDPTERISFWSRLYYTFFPIFSDSQF
jgi:hypothetical protein